MAERNEAGAVAELYVRFVRDALDRLGLPQTTVNGEANAMVNATIMPQQLIAGDAETVALINQEYPTVAAMDVDRLQLASSGLAAELVYGDCLYAANHPHHGR